jgi:hypothetical protein
LAKVQQALGEVTTEASDVGILLFSGPKQVGLADLAETLHAWMHPAAAEASDEANEAGEAAAPGDETAA